MFTPGSEEAWIGIRKAPRRQHHHDLGRLGGQVGPQERSLADAFRDSLLRDRDDVDRLGPLRRGPLWLRGVPRLTEAGRPPDRLGPCLPQDVGATSPDLRPDARAQVGHRHGRVCDFRRTVQAGL